MTIEEANKIVDIEKQIEAENNTIDELREFNKYSNHPLIHCEKVERKLIGTKHGEVQELKITADDIDALIMFHENRRHEFEKHLAEMVTDYDQTKES